MNNIDMENLGLTEEFIQESKRYENLLLFALHSLAHFCEYSRFENLKKYCTVVDDRIVDEGDVITARGVSSSIDLGLYLCEKLAGLDAKEKIRIQMDYQTTKI